jgi:DNA polymerase-3 subunit epsilon
MKPVFKYWLFLLAIAFAVFAVITGSFIASWYHLSADEQQFVRGIVDKLIPFPFIGSIVLFAIIGSLISLLFHHYIIPILQLGEETKLISVVNPGYRVEPRGAKELVHLANIINESAEAFQKLQTDVDLQIAAAKQQLKEERNRLAALMSELPSGVLVCNTDGQVLLYNQQAQRLLQQPGKLIGLGRSVFGVLDREPILHALDVIFRASRSGKKSPTTSFIINAHESCNLRVNMAPVLSGGEDRKITGFVLALEDMTHQFEDELRRDQIMQTLTEAMRFSTAEIREAISTILGNPELTPDQLQSQRHTIDRASQAMQEQLLHAKQEYARELAAPGKAENILANDLLELVKRHLRRHLQLKIETSGEEELWLTVDSYAILQSLTQLASYLQELKQLGELQLSVISRDDNNAMLMIEWPGCHFLPKIVERWQRQPMVRDVRNRMTSVIDLVVRSGGTINPIMSSQDCCHGVEVLLPKAEPEVRFEDVGGPEHRPVYYEFDLFNQQGWEELGQQQLNKLTFVVFDTETTGLNPAQGDEIIQIGAIRIVNGRILYDETIDQLVDPRRSVPAESVAIHGIDPELLIGQPTIDKVLPSFYHFAEGSVLCAHNAAFDMKLLKLKEEQTGLLFDHPVIDTLLLSSIVHPNLKGHSLEGIARRLDIPIVGRHTALGDAIVTAEVLIKLIPLLEADGIYTLEQAIMASAASQFAKLKYH